MARFLPFDPAHDQIYEEYQIAKGSLNLDTVAYQYFMEAVNAGADMVVLTLRRLPQREGTCRCRVRLPTVPRNSSSILTDRWPWSLMDQWRYASEQAGIPGLLGRPHFW
ncbi:MAG: hypothetical protein ABS40_20745 [Agrobacterium sp. SCN 61-19]|nr:MAG: hypothetical protein ABS40_20745 [Agrobacterium sp. SCN 61-19]